MLDETVVVYFYTFDELFDQRWYMFLGDNNAGFEIELTAYQTLKEFEFPFTTGTYDIGKGYFAGLSDNLILFQFLYEVDFIFQRWCYLTHCAGSYLYTRLTGSCDESE